MPATLIARRYAEAYFSLAQEKGAVDAWRAELARAVETVANPAVQTALANPQLALGDRVQLASNLLDGSSREVQSLVRLLIERSRASVIGSLLEEYDRLADRARGVVHAQVISAVELDQAARTSVTQAIAKQTGGEAKTEFITDASIIGGLVVRIGDRVIDDSVRTHLQQLQANLA